MKSCKRFASVWTGVLVGVAIVFAVPAEARSPAIVTAWDDMVLDRETCITRARIALTSSGFDLYTSETLEYSVGGYRSLGSGEYSGLVRCVPDKRMVFFVAVGNERSTAEALVRYLQDNFVDNSP